MTAAVCLDQRGGMGFNGRRQSMDRAVRADLLREAAGRTIWMTAYSRGQFTEEGPIALAEDPMAQAGAGDLCFMEHGSLRPWLDKVDTLLVYRWDKVYPADARLDPPLEELGWTLVSSTAFPGHSHKEIGKELYRK